MASTTTMQNVQTLKNELNRLSPMLRDLPNQLNTVNELIGNIETQVASLEQMKSKIQQQTVQSADDANDQSNFEDLVREITGKSWAAISRLFGKNNYKDVPDANAVAGVRGSIEYNSNDKLKGGKGDKTKDEDLNKKQLEIGESVEMEHTSDPELAREIAKDHLSEELQDGKNKKEQEYYTELKKIHRDECEDTVPSFWRTNLDYWSHNE